VVIVRCHAEHQPVLPVQGDLAALAVLTDQHNTQRQGSTHNRREGGLLVSKWSQSDRTLGLSKVLNDQQLNVTPRSKAHTQETPGGGGVQHQVDQHMRRNKLVGLAHGCALHLCMLKVSPATSCGCCLAARSMLTALRQQSVLRAERYNCMSSPPTGHCHCCSVRTC
jgi:hypothetical protein